MFEITTGYNLKDCGAWEGVCDDYFCFDKTKDINEKKINEIIEDLQRNLSDAFKVREMIKVQYFIGVQL